MGSFNVAVGVDAGIVLHLELVLVDKVVHHGVVDPQRVFGIFKSG